MADKKPSFAERIARLDQVAEHLVNAHAVIVDELAAMREVRQRFSERSAERKKARE